MSFVAHLLPPFAAGTLLDCGGSGGGGSGVQTVVVVDFVVSPLFPLSPTLFLLSHHHFSLARNVCGSSFCQFGQSIVASLGGTCECHERVLPYHRHHKDEQRHQKKWEMVEIFVCFGG